ncbi:cellulose-binding domain-containing protein [Streptomyces tricolor]|nr:cellulose-binding domain-containing protein [Streptomyces tricolor]
MTNLWNGSLTTAGGRATVRNTAANGLLPPGGTTSFGFTSEGAPRLRPPTAPAAERPRQHHLVPTRAHEEDS